MKVQKSKYKDAHRSHISGNKRTQLNKFTDVLLDKIAKKNKKLFEL